MAKPKKSFEDLDAELAQLEAELAALEGGKKAPPRPKAKKAEAPPAPAPAPAKEAPPAEPKKRMCLKLPGRKKAEPAPAPDPAPAPAAPMLERPPEPVYDASLWKREDDAWVRAVPGVAPIVRRVLDEQGNVVREEPATPRDLDKDANVKAERGAGRLLGRFKR